MKTLMVAGVSVFSEGMLVVNFCNRKRIKMKKMAIRLVTALVVILLTFAPGILMADTATFNYTDSLQTWVVPSGVTSIQVDVAGAQGGTGWSSRIGGKGARVQTTLSVTPGETLYIYVGGAGQNNNLNVGGAGGYNGGGGGGNGQTAGTYEGGGGGGGASDIRRTPYALSNRLVVAGGGGGAGGYESYNAGAGGENGGYGNGTGGGGGGTQISGGVGGAAGTYGTAGASGGAGSGGKGGNGTSNYTRGGGGGGGGYYGGGGGGGGYKTGVGTNGGGGGGSSYSAGIDTTYTTGYRGGNGQITFIIPLPPSVTTQTATNVLATTATGNGNITADGGASITAHGVCWSITADPTTTDSYTDEGVLDPIGTFSSEMTGLSDGTLYHYRAYATNCGGTGYGADTTFTTNAVPNTPAIGNYNTGSSTSDTTPTLQFDLSDPDSGDLIKYRIQIADNGSFSAPVVDYTEDSYAASPRDNVTYTPSALDDGSYYWRVKCIDDEGAESEWAVANNGEVAFIVDTIHPDAPVITEFTYNSSGEISSINGTAEANATVYIYDGDSLLDTVIADGEGNWTYTPAVPLDPGSHSISAIAEDAAENPSATSYYYSLNQVMAVNVFKDTDITHSDSATSIRLEKEAFYEFKFAVNADTPVTVSAYLQKNASYGAHTEPTLTLAGLGIDGAGVATASGGAVGSWSELTVAGTPNAKGVLTLKVETFSPESDARAWLDDISVAK